jgi:hypothetical protein
MAKRKGVVARVWQGSVGDRRPYADYNRLLIFQQNGLDADGHT